MICLPNKDPNQYDLFNENINFPPEPSNVYPPNMQDIMDELADPNAILPSPNIAEIDKAIAELDDILINPTKQAILATKPIEQQQLINGNYNFAGDSRFNPYTSRYDARFPPLLGNIGGVRDVLNVLRTHLSGVPTSIPGALGSLGQANAFRTFGYIGQGNALQRHLGLGAIPDCGLLDALLGLLKDLLQPLIDLLAALLGPLIELIAAILGILAAILRELFELLNLLDRLLRFLQAGQLLSLDPCAVLGMAQIGSPSLNAQVNQGLEWKNPDAPQIPDPGDLF